MCSEVTDEEIWRVMWSLPANKAPGPDDPVGLLLLLLGGKELVGSSWPDPSCGKIEEGLMLLFRSCPKPCVASMVLLLLPATVVAAVDVVFENSSLVDHLCFGEVLLNLGATRKLFVSMLPC
ncbi:hypothetical protein U1Q18_003457 [Sarracenia purpurea var. burkii]